MAVHVSSLPVAHANSSKTVTFTGTKRREIVRQANMRAARAVADIIRTTLDQRRVVCFNSLNFPVVFFVELI